MKNGLLTLFWGLFGGFLIFNGIAKALDPGAFAEAVSNYKLLPDAWVRPAAAGLVLAETAAGCGVIAPRSRGAAAYLAIAMLSFFALVVGASVLNGLDIECGCSTGVLGASKVGWALVARNLVLAGLVLGALRVQLGHRWGQDPTVLLFSSRFSTVLLAIFTLMLGQTVYLAQQNHILRRRVTSSAARTLRTGEQVPTFEARSLEGSQSETVEFGESGALLFVLSATCPHCIASVPSWNQRFEQETSASVLGVSVSTEVETRQFAEKYATSFPIVLPEDTGAFVEDFRAHAVPQTLSIGQDGKVLSIRVGRLRLPETTKD